ncbi:putative restriction endonuclease [Geodermatophilus siccatus]|uniref:Putative restriction endonuclease n=1 Tax=Geodermatophilus siccatus TaxID=1137991 RepID=A0A1G9R2L7_9ACTN|nr:HNH endonuclease [Geodermatophilus siccatus]SDM17463.1 putative restriction endonuclease [Geodermatophilus siccatus]
MRPPTPTGTGTSKRHGLAPRSRRSPSCPVQQVLERLSSLRQHQQDGRRSPHEPLLVLLALGRLATTGTSALPWSEAESQLADLLQEFGPTSKTGRAQSAAYPFTRLRSDGVWTLDRDVPMDTVSPLREGVTGRLEASLEAALRDRPELLSQAARGLVESHFLGTVAPDVLVAVGTDPDLLEGRSVSGSPDQRRRSGTWPAAVIAAWDRQCAFCGFDGAAGGAVVGIEAAHVRSFKLGGPDDLDNGLALCSLHHKLFDRGMLGLDDDLAVVVSQRFSARTPQGRTVYDLARPTAATGHSPAGRAARAWHREQVFQGMALAS